ncbi:hypothetical protein [Actinoplanes sp. RD1]|uniref:hypothetical protein n=1 Tax=Actinoplanes sp. RD1 TaxID=3064538 RepID=UPI0027411AA4|nr:hypothetical protein [Actinoplanes sp. RD1]
MTRTYRHWPWIVVNAAILLGVAALMVTLVVRAVRAPGFELVVTTTLAEVLLAVIALLLVRSRRIRTEIDDTAVTQHWVTRSFRIPFDEITAVEVTPEWGRWFLRIRCGERTYEVIPCHNIMFSIRPANRPPRALSAVLDDLELRLAAR